MIPPPERPRCVAIVDDHEPFRRGICALLGARGYTACDFDSVPRFIESGAMSRIDCLILDVAMPEIDGLALHACLRQTNYQFPVIFCTGYDADDRIRNALAEGAVGVLQKPVDPKTLLDAVASACARSSGRP
ncbi:MAG TPA: response regulator [Opitutaceae bacterium]|nr:response regulator [Opitutaceae bacterium]